MLFGTIMAMAIGLVGWMLVYLILVMGNLRIFKVGAGSVLTMTVSLAVGEMPLLNALPALTFATARLYRAQIKRERAELKEWEKTHAAQLQQQREEQRQQLVQAQRVRIQAEEAQEKAAREEEEMKRDENQEATYNQRESGGYDEQREPDRSSEEESTDIQFETMRDALSELNDKQNRTLEENRTLLRAKEIMERGSLNQNENDPVLRAAYERAAQGQKVYDGSPENRNGFVFKNLRKTSSITNLGEWRERHASTDGISHEHHEAT